MHGPITKPRNATDRSSIMRDAWSLWRTARAECDAWDDGLAEELLSRWAFITRGPDEIERDLRIASVTGNYRQFVAGPRPAPKSFGDCMRHAWVRARWSPAPMTEFAARRFAAECCDDDARRCAELAQIDREERATAA